MNDLCVHVDGKNVPKEVVYAVPTPRGTRSHRPVPHKDVVEEVLGELRGKGMVPAKESYALARHGNRMFGVIDFKDALMPEGMGIAIGIRNAHDKSMKLGVAGGTRVFVCDNLAFGGTVVRNRKHTRRISVERVVRGVIDRVIEGSRREGHWMDRLKQIHLQQHLAKAVVLDSYRKDACTLNQLNKVIDNLFLEEKEDAGLPPLELTAWTVYQSFTHAFKGNGPETVLNRCARLNRVFSDLVLPREPVLALAV
jgi:hypothetical protein